jgi:hypothetical protein
MSTAISFLKKVDGYVPEIALESFQRAATKAGIFCFGFSMEYQEADVATGGEGTLSEKDQATLSKLDTFDWQEEKTFLFRINVPDQYNGSSWLTNDPNYFEAIYINNPGRYDEGEFIFRFVVSYFEDNPDDYLWYDSSGDDFYYTATDIKKLSTMPYNPSWYWKKLV